MAPLATTNTIDVPEVPLLAGSAAAVAQFENRLAQVRTGIASSLYIALRAKHAPTAAHSLRVALFCSSWSYQLELSDEQRDVLEIAALLHDVGKIGVPDHLLMKPGPLTSDEADMVRRYRQHGLDILSACCCHPEILDSVRHAASWFGPNPDEPHLVGPGQDLPLAARMIAIVDAYDSMISEQVYRRPMSQERAVAELFSHAGSQFDPCLVEAFSRLQLHGQFVAHQSVMQRWLHQLSPSEANRYWGAGSVTGEYSLRQTESLFHDKMLDNMLHGVIYVDTCRQIIRWNAGAERITGIQAESVLHTQWDMDTFRFWSDDRKRLTNESCPIQRAIQSKCQTLQRVVVRRVDRDLHLDLHAFPVVDERGICQGAAILLRDATSETSLEQTVQDLHLQATRDPLTKAANRSEFDRQLDDEVQRFREMGIPASLIICDLDHFKSVNDTFGHQAGDAVLIGFSDLLQTLCRPEDLVARYGGEEFAVICPDCDIAAATARAERFRVGIMSAHFPQLTSRTVTASFGVTQVQSGDSAETVVKRADRALYQAKEHGRNRVVQLGSGDDDEPKEEIATDQKPWLGWLRGLSGGGPIIQRRVIAQVPIDLAVEKLRGFVADHSAEVLSVKENHLVLSIDSRHVPLQRRNSDRPTTMILDALLEPCDETTAVLGTRVTITISAKRNRDRRSEIAVERAVQLLRSLKAYLVAHDDDES